MNIFRTALISIHGHSHTSVRLDIMEVLRSFHASRNVPSTHTHTHTHTHTDIHTDTIFASVPTNATLMLRSDVISLLSLRFFANPGGGKDVEVLSLDRYPTLELLAPLIASKKNLLRVFTRKYSLDELPFEEILRNCVFRKFLIVQNSITFSSWAMEFKNLFENRYLEISILLVNQNNFVDKFHQFSNVEFVVRNFFFDQSF